MVFNDFKILVLKAEKVFEFFISKSKLFHSTTVDEKKKRIYKSIMFATEEGNLIISSCVTNFDNVRKYSEEILRRLTFKYLGKVAEFSIPSSFRE